MQFLDKIRVVLRINRICKKVLNPVNQMIRKVQIERMNRIYRKYGAEAFSVLVDTLNDVQFSYWPEFGTLLGIFREHDFIKHDNDFDFGAFVNDADKLKTILTNSGFVLKHEFFCPQKNTIREFTFSYKGVSVDFFFFERKEDVDCCYSFIPNVIDSDMKLNYLIKVFNFPSVNLSEIEFKGKMIKIPANTHDHLRVSYGPTFMTPDPSFKSINHNYLDGIFAYQR